MNEGERMSSGGADAAAAEPGPALVPELLVADIAASLFFWRDLCGFELAYERAEEGFAYLVKGGAHLMLDQRDLGRSWISAPLEHPFGRGVNLQISVPVDDLESLLTVLRDAQHELFMEPETKWYRVGGGEEAGVRQFLVADPDGYLIRFQGSLGRRRAR